MLAEKRGHALGPGRIRTAPSPIRHRLSPDDARHLPDLIAAGLAFLLLTGTGAASWYAIIGALPPDAQMTPGTPIAASDVRGAGPLPAALTESGTPVPRDLQEAIAASPSPTDWSVREVWLPAALDPVLSEPVPAAIETAVAPAARTPAKPVPDVVATAAEPSATPEVVTDPAEVVTGPAEIPAGQVSAPSAGASVIGGSGDSRDRSGSSFSDSDPEKPAGGLSSVTTASRVGTGGGTGNHSAPAGRSSSTSAGSDPNPDASGSTASPGGSSDSNSDTGGSNASPGGSDTSSGADQTKDRTKGGGHQTGGNNAAPGGKTKDHAKGGSGADQGGKQGKDAKESHGGKGPGAAGQDAKDNKGKDQGDKNKDKGGGKGHGDKDKGGKGNGKGGD